MPFIKCDQSRGADSFREKEPAEARMRLMQSNCQTENEQNVTHDVEDIVEPPATLALHEFRARDLAIASIENAEDLEKNESPDKRPIVSLCEHERRHHWDRKNEPGPSVRRGRKSQKQSSDRARNRAIEMARNETVLRFAASAQKFLFDVVNPFAVRDEFPGAFSRRDVLLHVRKIGNPVGQKNGTCGSTSLREERTQSFAMEEQARAQDQIVGLRVEVGCESDLRQPRMNRNPALRFIEIGPPQDGDEDRRRFVVVDRELIDRER